MSQAWLTGAAAGEEVGLCVSTTPPERFHADVFRLGWYAGAGARLVARLPARGTFHGAALERPLSEDPRRAVEAAWAPAERLVVDDSWASGVYVARVRLDSGPLEGAVAYAPFVVRAPAAERAPILVQLPVTTVQAYNN